MLTKKSLSAVALAVTLLAGCGGGGGSSASATATPSLVGTAAVGAPLPNAEVTLKDAAGKEKTVRANAQGEYTFSDVSGLVAPLMIRATGTAGGTDYTLYSMATTVPTQAGVSGVVNVTPATDSVVTQALGTTAPEDVFKDETKIKAVDSAKLNEAKARLTAAVKDVLLALGQDPAKVDLFTTRFEANNKGLDKLLDLVDVQTVPKDGGAADIRVARKDTGAAVTLGDKDDAAKVAPLPKPDEKLVALNTATIKDLFAAFNALTGSKNTIQSQAMKDLFDEKFLMEGLNRDGLLAEFVDEKEGFVGGKLLDFVLGACNGETKVCEGTVTAQDPSGSKDQFGLPVRQGSDGKWRVYGNQSPFQFELKPVVQASYSVINGAAGAPSVIAGVNLWIPDSGFKAAVLSSSNDGGANWTPGMKLTTKPTCGTGNLVVDDGNAGNCSNFHPVPDANAVAANGYLDQGLRKFKIVVTKTDGTTLSFEGVSRKPLFTADTGKVALNRSGLGVDAKQMGSNSVSFTGRPDYVSVQVDTSAKANCPSSLWADWEGNAVAKLAGKISVDVAKNSPNARAGRSALWECDASTVDVANGKITRINLNGKDPFGRGVWVRYDMALPTSPSN